MYRSRYFKIEELVSKTLFDTLTEEACWRLIPQSVQQDLDALRSAYGASITINNYAKGLVNCGIREKDCDVGATKSRHKLFDPTITAFDLHCRNLPKLIELVKNRNRDFGISRIENPDMTKTWLHCEFSSDLTVGDLVIFDP